jgi:hypothetical protein
MAIWQDLVDGHGLTARYASVRRFVLSLRGRTPVEARVVITTPISSRRFSVTRLSWFLEKLCTWSPSPAPKVPSADAAKVLDGLPPDIDDEVH